MEKPPLCAPTLQMASRLASKDAIKFQLNLTYSQKFSPEVYLNLTFFPALNIALHNSAD